MSMECLSYAETYYFDKLPDYRAAILDFLKRHKLPLRRAYHSNGSFSGMTGYVQMAPHIEGHATRKGKKKIKWRFIKKRR